MKVMKIRRVGNSNVVSLPHELESHGYAPGATVMIEETPTGELRIVPTDRVRAFIREAGRKVIQEDQEALSMLAEYERAQAIGSHPHTAAL